MADITFSGEKVRSRKAIAGSPLRDFAVPHLVIDDLFSEDLVDRINHNWPEYGEGFLREVPGNHILHLYRKDYDRIAEPRGSFWRSFNETLWPEVVASVAEALAAPAHEVFGDLYYKHLSLDMPLTFMQADPSYAGHPMHTHFYHCPHWAFTMLLYIDPEDTCSLGTSIHQLLRRDGTYETESSYGLEDSDWRAEVAMDSFRWQDPLIPDRRYRDRTVDYKANRLFVFLDGPLALHSVSPDNPDGSASPERARDGGCHARRRILRSHVKIYHVPFYAKHSRLLPEPIEPVRYMRLMKPDAVLSEDDARHRNKVLRPFFRERLAAYGRAARAPAAAPRKIGLWDRLRGRTEGRDEFVSQVASRLP